MTKYIRRSEYERMCNEVIDEETGMTEMDLWEYMNPYTNLEIVEDE